MPINTLKALHPTAWGWFAFLRTNPRNLSISIHNAESVAPRPANEYERFVWEWTIWWNASSVRQKLLLILPG